MFEGDHNSIRPQEFRDHALQFLKKCFADADSEMRPQGPGHKPPQSLVSQSSKAATAHDATLERDARDKHQPSPVTAAAPTRKSSGWSVLGFGAKESDSRSNALEMAKSTVDPILSTTLEWEGCRREAARSGISRFVPTILSPHQRSLPSLPRHVTRPTRLRYSRPRKAHPQIFPSLVPCDVQPLTQRHPFHLLPQRPDPRRTKCPR